MSDDKVKVLIPAEDIKQRVQQLGEQISKEFEDKKLTMLGVLTGSIVFLTDLMREIEQPLKIGLMQASSYRGTATEPGALKVNEIQLPDLTGRDVLLVDDILDTGQTLSALLDLVKSHNPSSVRSAVLLWKKSRTTSDIVPDYYCFEVPDKFVVGYGLDYDDSFRQLPFIGEFNPG